MPTSNSPLSSGGPVVDVMALPLAIKTLTIDGKRMTPSFVKQLAEEPLLDEGTATLRGDPIGWLNLHQKGQCPECSHLHVLWWRDTALRLATVVAPDDSEYYQEQKDTHIKRNNLLLDLSALLLARKHSCEKSEYLSETTRVVTLGGFRMGVSKEVANDLKALSASRSQHAQALQALDTLPPAAQQSPPSNLSSALHQAEAVKKQYANQGILFAHPELHTRRDIDWYRQMQEEADGAKYLQQLTLPTQRGWIVAALAADQEVSSGSLWWRPTRPCSQDEASAIQSDLLGHLLPLRVLLAAEAIEADRRAICQKAEYIIRQLQLELPRQKKKTASKTQTEVSGDFPPDAWADHIYQQEKRQFEEYTERWQQHIAELAALEQLFVLS